MTDFEMRVYGVVKRIPRGRVASYGQVARVLGSRRLARAVGNALHKNPFQNVPCHRVVNSRGELASRFGKGGWVEQKRLLLSEGVGFKGEKKVLVSFLIKGF